MSQRNSARSRCAGADKIPYEDVTVVPAVGNSANAAVSAARLGLPVSFVSFVGDDRDGDEVYHGAAKRRR